MGESYGKHQLPPIIGIIVELAYELQTDPKHAQSAVFWNKYLLTCGQDKLVKAWQGEELVWVLEGHEATSYALSIHGDLAITGGSDHQIICWNLKTQQRMWSAPSFEYGHWSPDGSAIIAQKKTKRIAILDAMGEQQYLLPAVEKRAYALGFHGKQSLLGGNGIIHMFNGPEEAGKLVGHDSFVTNIRTNHLGITATAGMDEKLLLWQDGKIIAEHTCRPGGGLAWDGRGKLLGRSSDNHLAIIAADSGEIVAQTDVSVKGVYQGSFNANSTQFAVACADGKVRVYDL